MAPKTNARLVDQPPSASTSHEDHDEEESQVEESEEEEEEPEKNPSIKQVDTKKPNKMQKPPQTPEHHSSSQSGSSGEDSENESENTQPSPTASDFTIKPIVATNSPSKPTSNTSKKRPSETLDTKKGKDSWRKKSRVGGEQEERDEKMQPLPSGGVSSKVWNEDDVIALLKGILEFQSENGVDPYADRTAFLRFINEKLSHEFSWTQVYEKIRGLKKKYLNNSERSENGEDPVFAKPYDCKIFEISKRIWGCGSGGMNNGVDLKDKTKNEKSRKGSNQSSSVDKRKEEVKKIVVNEDMENEAKSEGVDFWAKHPLLNESFDGDKLSFATLSESARDLLKEKMSLIGTTKARELEERWEELRVKEIQLVVKRSDLMSELAKLVLDAMNE